MLFWRRLPPNEAWLLVLRALVLTVDLYRDSVTCVDMVRMRPTVAFRQFAAGNSPQRRPLAVSDSVTQRAKVVTGTVRSGTVTAGVRSAAIAGDLGIDRDTGTVTWAAVRVPAGPHWHHDAAGSVLRLRVSPGLVATAALKLSLATALLAPVPELSEARNLNLKFGPTLPSRWQVALQWIGTRTTELA